MAAASTAIANIYEPAIWAQYFTEMTTEQSLLVRSGIAGTDDTIAAAASQGGRLVDMPFWDDLAHDTGSTTRSKVVTDTDDAITPAGLTTDKDIAVKLFRSQAFQSAPIVSYVAGSDPVALIISRFAKWWDKEEQRLLLKVLYGIFSDATVATNLSHDIAGEVTTTDAAKLIGSDAILDTRFLLGDAFGKLTAMIMHSVPFKRLVKLDLIDGVPDSAQNPTAMPRYMGMSVLVDDNMTAVAGSTSGYKYHTFLFGPGAIARQDIPLESGDPSIELVREPLKGTGAGLNTIVTRRYMILHPRGIKYGGSLSGVTGPSDADLATDNWTQVYLTKNIRIARLITNG
jgi:hypothetical protein